MMLTAPTPYSLDLLQAELSHLRSAHDATIRALHDADAVADMMLLRDEAAEQLDRILDVRRAISALTCPTATVR